MSSFLSSPSPSPSPSPFSPPPKTLSFSTATLRDQKTLVWLEHQSPSVPWWRWDGIVTSVEAYHRWMAHGASIVGVVLLEPVRIGDEVDAWLEEVYRISKEVLYVVLSQACISCKSETYWKENFDNLFVLEQMGETYPFLGGEWEGTVEDAIRMLGIVCRYHRLVVEERRERMCSTTKPFYQMIVEEGTRPAEFVLITQYYTAKDKKRGKELRECLRRNVACRWVDKIVLLTERDESVAWASFIGKDKAKIEQRIIGKRLTYADFFQEVCRRYNKSLLSTVNGIVALANADIYLGDELAEAWRIQWRDRAVCLLRWDDMGEGAKKARLFGPRSDSQDVWMFSAQSIVERHWTWKDVNIPLGVPGCDNAILRPLLQQRFLLSNPALSLKTYHLHNSGVRTYTRQDTIASSVYIHLEPTYLVDSKQVFVPREAPQHSCHEVVSFTVRSSSLSDEITYCTMLEKEGRYRWEPMVENYAFEPAIPVYTWRGGAGVTPNGLVYDLYQIYTGRAALQQPEYNYWSSAGVDIFTPLLSCPRMAAIPLREARDVFTSWSAYVVHYLSRYLRLLEQVGMGVDASGGSVPLFFWLPEAFRARCARTFPSVDVLLGMPWAEGTACWAEEVVGFLPGPVGEEVGREEITALRSACCLLSSSPSSPSSSSSPLPSTEIYGVVWNSGVWTPDAVNQLRTWFPLWTIKEISESSEQIEETLAGASVFLWDDSQEAGNWLWCLPKGARVAEGQKEMEIRGESQHVAHMADLDARIFLFGRGSPSERMADWKERIVGTTWFHSS